MSPQTESSEAIATHTASGQAAESKPQIRRAARARRRAIASALTAEDCDRAGVIIADAVMRVLDSLTSQGNSAPLRVAAYQSLPEEPPTEALIARLMQAGHQVIVPITLPDFSLEWTDAADGSVDGVVAAGTTETVTRRDVQDGETTLGVDALAHCDLIIAPGLLIDRRGVRMGQGGGCYDRALAWSAKKTPVIALVHEGEFVDGPLPRDAHDQPVDGVLTTSGELTWLGGRQS